MFIDMMGFGWIVQQYYVAKHNNETEGIIGNTNFDTDDDECQVYSKIKQELTLAGDEGY
jgi:hypothetical protein